MPTFRYRGTREQLMAVLRDLPGRFTGRVADPSGAIRDVQLAMAETVLSDIRHAYQVKSQGGTDEMGIRWPDLAASTLALRRKVATPKALAKLHEKLPNMPVYRQKLIARQRKKLLELYRGNDAGARRMALRILRVAAPYMAKSRVKAIERELNSTKIDRRKALAHAGAAAEILRDTGRLMSSLSPGVISKPDDRIVDVGPGFITVGTNVQYVAYHQSAEARKLKKDGTPVLPRRQILPDASAPIPRAWWRHATATMAREMASRVFWQQLLGAS